MAERKTQNYFHMLREMRDQRDPTQMTSIVLMMSEAYAILLLKKMACKDRSFKGLTQKCIG